jgi:hypothetical protein
MEKRKRSIDEMLAELDRVGSTPATEWMRRWIDRGGRSAAMDPDMVRNLDAAISNADPDPRELDFFRLADSALLHAHATRLVGCELQDLAFLDVVFAPFWAHWFLTGNHPVLVRITAPPGTRALPLYRINDNNESDLLLARGTRSRVLSVSLASADAPLELHLEILP